MRPLKADEEAALRRIAERHGFLAPRGPHTGEGSATRLVDALLSGDVVTLALTPADRHRLVEWLDTLPGPAGRLTTILGSLATQLRPTLPTAPTPARTPTPAAGPSRGTSRLTTAQAAERLGLSPGRVQELARAGEFGRKDDGRWTFSATEIARCKEERDHRDLVFSLRYPHRRASDAQPSVAPPPDASPGPTLPPWNSSISSWLRSATLNARMRYRSVPRIKRRRPCTAARSAARICSS